MQCYWLLFTKANFSSDTKYWVFWESNALILGLIYLKESPQVLWFLNQESAKSLSRMYIHCDCRSLAAEFCFMCIQFSLKCLSHPLHFRWLGWLMGIADTKKEKKQPNKKKTTKLKIKIKQKKTRQEIARSNELISVLYLKQLYSSEIIC